MEPEPPKIKVKTNEADFVNRCLTARAIITSYNGLVLAINHVRVVLRTVGELSCLNPLRMTSLVSSSFFLW